MAPEGEGRLKIAQTELQQEVEHLRAVRAELKHSLEELREIQNLARTVRSSTETSSIVEALQTLLDRVLPEPHLGLFLYNSEHLLEAVGDPSVTIRQAVYNLNEEGICDWVLEEGRPVQVPDLLGTGSGKSDLLVPLAVMNTGIGVLLIRTPMQEQELTAQRMDLLAFAAAQAAMALENSRLLAQLADSRAQLQEMFDSATDLILLLDSEGRIRYSNQRAEVVAIEPGRLVGRCLLDFVADPEQRDRLLEGIANGHRSLEEVELPGEEGQPPLRVIQLTLTPLSSKHPMRASTMAIIRDMTERRRLEEQATEAERLRAVMLAAVTVNHEINNPLTTIIGNLFMIRRHLGEEADENLLHRLDVIETSCRKIETVARHLERVEEIKRVKYLGDTEMLDIDLHDPNKE